MTEDSKCYGKERKLDGPDGAGWKVKGSNLPPENILSLKIFTSPSYCLICTFIKVRDVIIVVEAQLVEQSFPTPMVRGSNPNIGKVLFTNCN